MAHTRTFRARLARVALALIALLIVAFLAFLPFAGQYLLVEDPLERSDAILVLAGARVARWLEGVDLYREGWAPHVVLSPGRIEPMEHELAKMGVRFPGEGELARAAMIQMRVPPDAVSVMAGSVDNTAQEADALLDMARRRGWRRVIVVTSKYHTRRAGFAFRRVFRGSGIAIVMRASRHDPYTPKQWWKDRASLRYVISELQKLAAYRLGLAS